MQSVFTKALYELFVRQDISLSQSLLIMSRKPRHDGVSRAAESLYKALENGSLFSNALRTCSAIPFDDVYISFILLAEKNGDLKSAVSYLKEKLEREESGRRRLFAASVYPAFVILISVGASAFVGLYTGTADFALLMKYIAGLLFVCGAVFALIFKLLKGDCLCEAFTAVDFLLKNGIELSEAVGCAVQIAGPSTRVGRIFENARMKLSYGMDLRNAFMCRELGGDKKLSEAFYYADTGGSQLDLFGRMAACLEAQNERRRTVCLSLVEPLFIVIAGGFILLLLMSFFMPLINDIGWI